MKLRIRMISRRAVFRILATLWLATWLVAVSVPARAAVTLLSFRATPDNDEVTLDWETATELDNAGFYIRRSNSQSGPFTRISPFIPSQGDPLTGTVYSWVDDEVVTGTVYWYQLEAVDLSQNSVFYGPISATPGSTDPTVTPSATSTLTPTATATGATSSPTATSTTTTQAATGQPSTAYPAPATPTFRPPATAVPAATLVATATLQPSLPPTVSTIELPTAAISGTATLLPLPVLTLTFPEGGIIIGGTSTATQPAQVEAGEGSGPGWSPTGGILLVIILVLIWGLLGAAFYFSFHRIA